MCFIIMYCSFFLAPQTSVPLSDGLGTRNLIFRYPESAEKWVESKLKKAFLHFLPYLMIFNVEHTEGTAKL